MSVSNMNMKQKMTKKKNNQDGFLLRFFALNVTINLCK